MPKSYVLHFAPCDGQNAGQEQFAALPIRIGRNPLNDCPLGLNFVSEFHACVEETHGRFTVRDLGSTNGVYVRTPEGTVSRIPAQTQVDLGPCNFQFLVGRLGVRLEIREAPIGADTRARKHAGSVLGNVSMLQGLAPPPLQMPGTAEFAQPGHVPSPGSLPPLPPLPGGATPDQYGSPSTGAYPQAHYPPPAPGYPAPGYPAAPGYPPNDPSARVGMNTQHFGMGLESLALMGLRELATSLVPGAPLETTGDIARLITKLHDSMEVFCRCFLPLREGYAQFISSMDLKNAASQRSLHRSSGYRQVEAARTPGEVANALLNFRDPSLDASAAVENIFADLMIHQVALLDGVMRGVKALLDELSPEHIEQSATGERRSFGIAFGGRHKALWDAYCERYAELSEESESFSRVLGAEFAEAYREYTRRRPPA
ncbi:MAG TPA: type VI secretion system-associated FHA domain protein [Polyangiaceae bacterium]